MSAKQAAVAAFFAGRKREAAAFVSAPKRRRLSAPTSRPDPLQVLAIQDSETTAGESACTDTELETELLAALASNERAAASSGVASVPGVAAVPRVADVPGVAAVPAELADGDLDFAVAAVEPPAVPARMHGLLEAPEIPLRPTCDKCLDVTMDPFKAVVTGKGAGC